MGAKFGLWEALYQKIGYMSFDLHVFILSIRQMPDWLMSYNPQVDG